MGTYAKIHPLYSVTFSTPNTKREPNRALFKKGNRHSGTISRQQQIKIKHAVELLRESSKLQRVFDKATKHMVAFKLNFITATLSSPQKHPDKYIMEQMFRPLLRWLKEVQHCKQYVWKVECQDNGNIHIHITANHFVPWEQLRNKWNQLQFDQGYIGPDANPNSTDVHAVRNEKQITGYLMKYLTKKDSTLKQCVISRQWMNEHFYKSAYSEWLQLTTAEKLLQSPLETKRIPECKLYDCTDALKVYDSVCYSEIPEVFQELWHLGEIEPPLEGDFYKIYRYSRELFTQSLHLKTAHEKIIERVRSSN